MDFTTIREAKVKDLVIDIPRSDDFFKKHRIDFCCGGNKPLHEALAAKELNEQEVITELKALAENATQREDYKKHNWSEASYSELINHVISTHHDYLAKELPDLSFYVTKIMRVHGANRPELSELHHAYHKLKTELEQHMVKEEQVVFPSVSRYEQTNDPDDYKQAVEKINELEAEHEEAGNLLGVIRKLTNDFTPPEGACTTYKMTFSRLEDLESDMFQHVHLENNILFPRLMEEAATKA